MRPKYRLSYRILILPLAALLAVTGILIWLVAHGAGPRGITDKGEDMRITGTGHVNALYEWRDFRTLDSGDYANKLDRLSAAGFNKVYISVNPYVDIADSGSPDQERLRKEYRSRLRDYVSTLSGHGFAVGLLAGDATWYGPDKTYLNHHVLDLAKLFNQEYAAHRIRDIQFDIEPYNLPRYARDKRQVLREYLQTVSDIYAYDGSPFALGDKATVGFAIPYWFDQAGTQAVQVEHAGRFDYPMQHIANMADDNGGYIAVMAYRNTLDGSDGVMAHIRQETEYARLKKSVTVLVAQEVADVQPAKITYHSVGTGRLIASINRLHGHHDGVRYYQGVVINDLAAIDL